MENTKNGDHVRKIPWTSIAFYVFWRSTAPSHPIPWALPQIACQRSSGNGPRSNIKFASPGRGRPMEDSPDSSCEYPQRPASVVSLGQNLRRDLPEKKSGSYCDHCEIMIIWHDITINNILLRMTISGHGYPIPHDSEPLARPWKSIAASPWSYPRSIPNFTTAWRTMDLVLIFNF